MLRKLSAPRIMRWTRAVLTAMPGTSQPSVRCQNAILQWSTKMRAIAVDSGDLAIHLDQENLAAFNAFYFDFLLITILQVKRGKIFELKLLTHVG